MQIQVKLSITENTKPFLNMDLVKGILTITVTVNRQTLLDLKKGSLIIIE